MASEKKSSPPPSPKSPSSSSTVTHFGSNAPGLRKAMMRLEVEFGHPHISKIKNDNNVPNIHNNTTKMMNSNVDGYTTDNKNTTFVAANSLTDQSPVVVAVNDDDQNQSAVADPPLIRDKVKLEHANN
ncbi:hypothetical protein P8452_14460 [Trifolium repens]|jgi:hypothetical protein|nr:hypothetical protein QL285_010317 [Trifolium repens]WJX25420.1 hypothetical protein P8452_14460 [Trifolium repens]